jgi:hypothetical protein
MNTKPFVGTKKERIEKKGRNWRGGLAFSAVW